MSSICFVASTPFTVNAFLVGHLMALAEFHDVSLCINPELYPLSPVLDPKKVKVIPVPLQRQLAFASDIRSLVCLWRVFRRHRFDVVHSFTPKAGLLAMIAAFVARVPKRFHTFTGQIWVTQKGISRWLYKNIDRVIARLSTRVFADSASQIRFVVEQGICPEAAISQLGAGSISGVDLSRFTPNLLIREELRHRYGAKSHSCVFLFMGRLCKDKGIFDLLRAFKTLSHHDQEAQLWLVGPDEEGIQAQVLARGRGEGIDKGVNARIQWLGRTFEPEAFMAAADALVLPSYREGFGSVIIEAAACGLPTVAYRIDGVVDAVVESFTGLLSPAGDEKALAANMRALIEAPLVREQMGRHARKRVLEHFSSQTVTQAWLSFYAQELGSFASTLPPDRS